MLCAYAIACVVKTSDWVSALPLSLLAYACASFLRAYGGVGGAHAHARARTCMCVLSFVRLNVSATSPPPNFSWRIRGCMDAFLTTCCVCL